MTPTLDAALAWQAAGCSVVRVATDGTKRPLGAWKQYQTSAADPATLTAWFTGGHPGVGVVTGAVSSNLEMLELEGRAMTVGLMAQMRELADASGLLELLERVLAGYAEFTPTGGFHLYYRVSGPIAGNTKLARRPATADELAENPVDKVKVLVETRGEGGFVVVAPSYGPTHPTGKPWVAVPGRTPADIPTLTPDERDALHILAAAFDQMPDEEPVVEPRRTATAPDVLRPGDDYNARATWTEILTPHGWTPVHTWGGVTYWRRPGKNEGVSATTGRGDRDNIYVFTTSTAFDSERPYTKFAAYTLLEHRGDYTEAARALRSLGYGDPEPTRTVTVHEDLTPEQAEAATVGTDGYTLTDDGNALRLVDTHAETIRYVHERSTWLIWRDNRWVWDTDGEVSERARALARALPAESRAEHRHRLYSLSARGISATERLARTDRRVIASLGHLDARPYELNTPAGAVDLRTGALLAPDPAALHTRTTTVVPDLTAVPHRWLRFLAETFAGDAAMTTYVQRLLGLSIIGTVLEQILPFAHGEGSNGKTTLLEVAERLIGTGDTGYAMSAPSELLLKTTHPGHPTEIARLAGARFVLTSELEEGERFAEARVKKLTGGDTLSGRFMGQDFFDFRPTHTIWLLANHQPAVRSGGPAFWRRLKLIPFLHTVPPERRDPHLIDTLIDDEGPAILAWIITGARDYLTAGLETPTAVAAATETYATDQDTVARFVAECCRTGDVNAPHLRTRTTDLRSAYETWCRTEGETPVSPRALTLALRARFGVESAKSNGSRLLLGIRLDDTDTTQSHQDLTQSPVTDLAEKSPQATLPARTADEEGWSW